MGAEVDVVPAYQTIRPEHDTVHIREMLEKGTIDMVTFTSSSTVDNFAEMFTAESKYLQQWMTEVTVACIGPITAKTAREKGFSTDLVSSEYTIEAFTDSIVEYFKKV
jgi:uroporphyrinogen III methyltransferase/synthase